MRGKMRGGNARTGRRAKAELFLLVGRIGYECCRGDTDLEALVLTAAPFDGDSSLRVKCRNDGSQPQRRDAKAGRHGQPCYLHRAIAGYLLGRSFLRHRRISRLDWTAVHFHSVLPLIRMTGMQVGGTRTRSVWSAPYSGAFAFFPAAVS